MIDIEKLAVKHKVYSRPNIHYSPKYQSTLEQLEAFAKAYLNKWLKEQEVVGYMHSHGLTVSAEARECFDGFDTPLIALPSEVK